jgi:hypothetical protein
LNFCDLITQLKLGGVPKGWTEGAKALPALEWQSSESRAQIGELSDRFQAFTHQWLMEALLGDEGEPRDPELVKALGLELSSSTKKGSLFRSRSNGRPTLEIHSLRSSYRPTEDGRTIHDLVLEITQRRRGYLDERVQADAERLAHDATAWDQPPYKPRDFVVRGGCTLLIDGQTGAVRYAIVKPIFSESRLARQRAFALGMTAPSLRATYMRAVPGAPPPEPFGALHRGW